MRQQCGFPNSFRKVSSISFFRRKPVNPKEHKPVEVTQWRFHVRKKKNEHKPLSAEFF